MIMNFTMIQPRNSEPKKISCRHSNEELTARYYTPIGALAILAVVTVAITDTVQPGVPAPSSAA